MARRDQVQAQAEQLVERRRETLGTIRCPSGTLALLDIGLLGFLPREALEPAIVKVEVPRDRDLTVTGTRVGQGRFSASWDHVAIELADGEVHGAKKLGHAAVDLAHLTLIDHAALDHWQHEDSLDGLADIAYRGRDEAQLARVMRGSRDLPVDVAEAKLTDAHRYKADNHWLVEIEFRPHSHYYFALAAARASRAGAGTLELDGSQLLLFSTSWGSGVFPIFLDTDADDRPVRVRIQLANRAPTADKVTRGRASGSGTRRGG